MSEITELAKLGSKPFGEMIGYYLRSAWYFEHWYEKVILAVLGALGIWKIAGFIF